MARVNYQREKRLKDLDRQRKQEEKRARKFSKDLAPAGDGLAPGTPEPPAEPEGTEKQESGD